VSVLGSLGVKAVIAIVKKIEAFAPQPEIDRILEKWGRDQRQIAYSVCKALLADRLGRPPDSEEIEDMLASAGDDPSFPARAYRILGEARKSPSRRRRVFLASIMYGLPFSRLPEDERDRVDMVAERMTPEDADLLKAIAHRVDAHASDQRIKGATLFVVHSKTGVSLVASKDLKSSGERAFEQGRIDPHALSALTALGCVEVRSLTFSEGDERLGYTLHMTAIGKLVLTGLEKVKAGLSVE
jgi:hypothetical protein